MDSKILLLSCLALVSACGGDAPRGEICSDAVCYRVTFTEVWNAINFPTQYPASSHFSPLVGAVHGPGVDFFELGQGASAGIESMAETGATAALIAEVDSAVVAATARGAIRGPGISNGKTVAVTEFGVSNAYPLVTLLSMVAPSPDWFVGVDSLSLKDSGGNFYSSLSVDLVVYDAGSDSGVSFTSANSNSVGVVTRLTCVDPINHCGFSNGEGTDGVAYVGRFLFENL